MADTHEPASFADVLRYELEAVRRRRYEVRQAAGNPPDTPEDLDERVEKLRGKGIEELRGAALDDGMVGLALSGGGVRSATFGLGFLQGVSRLGLLSAVDYLSTVSGGGFVGGWLTAWIHREEQRLEAARKAGAAAGEVAGATANVEKQLHPDRKVEAQADRRVDVENPPGARDPDQSLAGLFPPPAGDPRPRPVLDDEPEPVYHLRAYSNYLAPRPSWFSGDMWTIFAIYFRNTLVNLLILVPVAFAAILLAYGLVWFFARADAAIGWWFTGFLLVAVVGAVYCLARSIVLLNRPPRPADPEALARSFSPACRGSSLHGGPDRRRRRAPRRG